MCPSSLRGDASDPHALATTAPSFSPLPRMLLEWPTGKPAGYKNGSDGASSSFKQHRDWCTRALRVEVAKIGGVPLAGITLAAVRRVKKPWLDEREATRRP